MGYRLIEGTFDLVYTNNGRRSGSRPDGDTVWFKPNDPRLVEKLGGGRAKMNAGGMVTLRLEAFDALETHYGTGGHQRWGLALGARDELLKALRFASVTYNQKDGEPTMTVASTIPDQAPGFILTRGIDSPRNGRVVAFAFAGKAPKPDGTEFIVPPSLIRDSANFDVAKKGLAYPAYYADTLPADIRGVFDKAFAQAQASKRGIWSADTSRRKNKAAKRADLEDSVIWPKLFRRLWDFFGTEGASLKDFRAWLEAEPEDRDDALWIKSVGQLANLHDVVETGADWFRMKFPAEDLIVVSKQPGTVASAPSPQLRAA